jgi:hypothetical protein
MPRCSHKNCSKKARVHSKLSVHDASDKTLGVRKDRLCFKHMRRYLREGMELLSKTGEKK